MRFGLLGSLEVRDDSDEPVELGGIQARTVLAALLAASGRIVTADALLDAVWGEDPPASAAGTLQSYISRLRRALEPGRDRGAQPKLLVWEPPGYRLAVPSDDIDFRRFEHLADEGRTLLAAGRHADARATLAEADALWRGPALVEFLDRDFAAGLATRLEERRVAAAEDRVEADLALGRHGAVIGELSELVAAHPLREALRGQLAIALYRAGRQADALRALDDTRRVLRDELGVDLSPRLRQLEADILAHAPSLAFGGIPAPVKAAPAPLPPRDRDRERERRDGLIGRGPELAELLASLAEATAATRAVVVEGEPGIGKTRLVEELAAEATVRGALVLWGRAFEGGAAPAFWPWLPPLRTLAARQPDGTSAPAEIATLLSPAADDAPDRLAAEQGRFALVEGVVSLLTAVSRTHPIVLILDDLQWADAASLDLLTLVTARLDDVPLLVLCTVRELEVGRHDEVVDALASLSRQPGTRRLHLRGLSRDATAELVARTTGRDEPELAAAIYERAEGNPFFTTELARLIVSAGDQPPATVLADVPTGVRDVVRRRLTQLPPATVELLHVAAVIGRDVDVGLLTRAAGTDLDACLDALDAAVVHRLLVSVPDQPGTYRFSHALVREVVADDISSLKRARLHLRVAEALDDTDDTAEIVAEHLWAAASIGAAERAAAALERAARVAVRRLAYGSAIHLLERAVQLRRSLGSTTDDLDAELHALALLVSAIAALRGYASLNGSPLLMRGKELAERTGRASEMLHLLWAEWAGLDIACEYRKSDPIAEQLLALSLESDDPIARVLGHTAYGISRWHRGELTESSEHLDAARSGSRSVRASDLVLFDLDQLRLAGPFSVYLHVLRGDVGDAEDIERRFADVVREIPDDPYWELLVLNFAASGAISVGQFEAAERAARRGIAVDPEHISAFWSTALRAYLGVAVALQGRIDEGLPILEEAWAAYRAIGVRTNETSWMAGRAQALAEAGRVDEAAAAVTVAEQALAATGEGYARSLLLMADAAVHRARGDEPATVAALLGKAHDLATRQGGHGIARRIARTASSYGVAIDIDAVDAVDPVDPVDEAPPSASASRA